MAKPEYTYRAEVLKVVDGDTVDLRVDLGFRVTTVQRFRLARINAPEMHDARPDIQAKAEQAKERLELLLKSGGVILRSEKPLSDDKYGRWLAEIYTATGVDVNQTLIDEGLVKLYPGKY